MLREQCIWLSPFCVCQHSAAFLDSGGESNENQYINEEYTLLNRILIDLLELYLKLSMAYLSITLILARVFDCNAIEYSLELNDSNYCDKNMCEIISMGELEIKLKKRRNCDLC